MANLKHVYQHKILCYLKVVKYQIIACDCVYFCPVSVVRTPVTMFKTRLLSMHNGLCLAINWLKYQCNLAYTADELACVHIDPHWSGVLIIIIILRRVTATFTLNWCDFVYN